MCFSAFLKTQQRIENKSKGYKEAQGGKMMSFVNNTDNSIEPPRPTTYVFDDKDKCWFLHFEQPDPEEEQKAIKEQFNGKVFLPPSPFPPQTQKPGICPKFLCGMCLNGGLCTYKHEFIDDNEDDDVTIGDNPFFPCIITKTQIVQNIDHIDNLKGLYVVLLKGINSMTGGLCQQIMRVDMVVKNCFSQGKSGYQYGLTLSIEGNPQTEVVVRIDQLADYFSKKERKELFDRYVLNVQKLNGVNFNLDDLPTLSKNAHFFRLKNN